MTVRSPVLNVKEPKFLKYNPSGQPSNIAAHLSGYLPSTLTVLEQLLQEGVRHDDQTDVGRYPMKCPSCGAENPNDYRFCARCGTDMTAVPEEPVEENNTEAGGSGPIPKTSKPKNPNGKRNAVIAVALVLIIAVAAIAVFAMGSHDDTTDRPLDWLETPDGTYTYDASVLVNNQWESMSLEYTLKNGKFTSYKLDGISVSSSELDLLNQELQDQRELSYSYVDGKIWNDGKTECNTYLVTYDGANVEQVVSSDGRVICEESYSDGIRMKVTLKGWSEGRITHTVSFIDEYGTTYRTQTVLHGGQFTFPQPAIKEHYTFTGWMRVDSGVFYDANKVFAPVDSDMVFKATWSLEVYTIIFDANGGVNTHSQKCVYMNNYTLPDESLITRPGYELLGWSESPDAVKETYACGTRMTATEDKTYYAVWKDMSDVTHHVTYYGGVGWPYTMNEVDVKHGTILSNTDFLYGKDGYSFVCWTYNGKDIGSDTPVLSDMTLVGRWHKLSDMTQSGKTVTITLADKGVQHTIAWGDGSFSYVTDSASHTYTEDRFMTNIVVYQKDEATGTEYACQHSVYTKDFLNVSLALKCKGPLNQYTKESTWYLNGIDEDVDWYVNFTYMGRSDSVDVKLESPGIYWIMAVYSDGSDLRGLVSLNKLFEEQ